MVDKIVEEGVGIDGGDDWSREHIKVVVTKGKLWTEERQEVEMMAGGEVKGDDYWEGKSVFMKEEEERWRL